MIQEIKCKMGYHSFKKSESVVSNWYVTKAHKCEFCGYKPPVEKPNKISIMREF